MPISNIITPNEVGWGTYGGFEGPVYFGHPSLKYSLPQDPTENERRLAVVSATEGSNYSAVNMYDKCIVSLGLVQWCGANGSVSAMLGRVIEECGQDVVLVPLERALKARGASFVKRADGLWHFAFNDSRGSVDSLQKMQQLFLGCDGKKGSWGPGEKSLAKTWAACFATIWFNQDAKRVQAAHAASKLEAFVMPKAKATLFADQDMPTNDGWCGALRAAYISFAANLPVVADKHLAIAVFSLKSGKWSMQWCIGIVKQLTFGPNIKIYPERYDKIAPKLNELWGTSFPVNSVELKKWVE